MTSHPAARSSPLARSVRTFLWLVALVFVGILADVPKIVSYLWEPEAVSRGMLELSRALDSGRGRSYGLSRTELVAFFELATLPLRLVGGLLGIALTLRRSPHTARFWRTFLGLVGAVAMMELLFFASSVTVFESLEIPGSLYAGVQLALLVFCAVWIRFWNDPQLYGEAFGGPVDEGRAPVPLLRDPLAIMPLSALPGVALWFLYRNPTASRLVELGESMLALIGFS